MNIHEVCMSIKFCKFYRDTILIIKQGMTKVNYYLGTIKRQSDMSPVGKKNWRCVIKHVLIL